MRLLIENNLIDNTIHPIAINKNIIYSLALIKVLSAHLTYKVFIMTAKQRSHFLNLVRQGSINIALNELSILNFPETKRNELVGITSQFQQFQKKKQQGILSSEQETLQQNKITTRLIEFITQSHSGNTSVHTTPPPLPSTSFWQNKGVQWIGIIGSFASIIALWFIFFPFTDNTNPTKTATVLVHGKDGKDDIVLPNRGIVYLIFGDAKIPEQINNEGEATFKQIPSSFFARKAKVEILFEDPEGEPYRAAVPDSLYDLKANTYIDLEVLLEGMEQIRGIVKDFETGKSLDSVMIRVFGKDTYSNEYGEFVLDIPKAEQQQFITLRVFKDGYQDWEMQNIPTTTNKPLTIPLKKTN